MSPATYTLLFTNIAIYIIVSLIGFSNDDFIRSVYENFALNPISFIEGAFWQPITSMFLHSPSFPLHLLVNMIALWSFGSLLERLLGMSRFLWLYFVSGLFASSLVIFIPYLFGSYQVLARSTVGASGALMGLLGGVAILHPRSRIFLLFFPMTARTAAILLCIVSLLFAIFDSNSYISHSGHLGGLLGGVFYAKLVLLPEIISMQSSPPSHTPNYYTPKVKQTKIFDYANIIRNQWKKIYTNIQNKKRNVTPDQNFYKTELSSSQYQQKNKEKNIQIQNISEPTTYDDEQNRTEEKNTDISSKDTKKDIPRLFYDPNTDSFHYK